MNVARTVVSSVAAVLIAVLHAAEPAPLVIGPGETYYVGDTAGTQGGNPSCVYDLREGATLVITNAVNGSGVFWSAIYNTNGLATVDCSQLISTKTPCLKRGLRQGGDGALRIKTHSSFIFSSSSNEKAVWDARDVQLLNPDGTPYSDGGEIRFEECVAIIHAPTNCVSTFTKNPQVYLLGEGPAFADSLITVGNGMNLVVCNGTKIGPNQTVMVASGGTLTMHSADYQLKNGEFSRNSFELINEGGGAYAVAFPVVLEDDSALLVIREDLDLTFNAEIAGPGAVSVFADSTVVLGECVSDARWTAGADTLLTLAPGKVLREYVPTDSTSRLKVGNGATVRIAGNRERFLLENDNGIVLMGDRPWQDKVDVWFDMSRPETMIRPGIGTEYESEWSVKYYNNNPDTPYIDQVVDWRNPSGPWKLYLTANYANKSFTKEIVPYLETRADGLTFLSALGQTGNCRIPFYDTVGKKEASIEAKLVVMACRPVGGGGLLATQTGAFDRGGKGIDKPVAKSDDHDIWVDGEKIVPSTTQFDSDRWFVTSLDVTGEQIGLLGCANNSRLNCGGWAYGEVIVFMDDASEADRIAAEAYLAKKWGVAYEEDDDASEAFMNACTNAVSLTGDGQIVISNGTVQMYGQYSGAVKMDNGRVIAGEPPPTAAAVPTGSLAFWFDPEHLDNATTVLDKLGNTRLQYAPDFRDDDFTDQHRFLWGATGRQPWISRRVASDGYPERNWVDFSEPCDPDTDGAGNNLRLVTYTNGMDLAKLGTANLNPVSVSTGFVVTDSSRGGGSPILSDVAGMSGSFRFRGDGTVESAYEVMADAPIWSDRASDNLKNGTVRLNGTTADYRDGFTGGPELLTFQTTGEVLAGVFAYYQTGEKNAAKPNGRNGTSFEYLGEMLFYSTALAESDRDVVEGYLMNKWFGKVMPKYADITGVSVSGKGEVVVDRIARLPQFSDGFVGTVAVTDPDGCKLEMTIDPETEFVEGAVALPAGSVAKFPANSSITVSFLSRPRRMTGRSWRLVTASAFAPSVNWAFSFAGKVPSGARFVTDAQGVRVDLPAVGMIMIVR